ncbi:MAG: glycoside hydrolase N-terminal domain-containing protein [Clostridia bacterium]|nr:glycoside hydrolase N-terminal domain-containing protein [Clostridia bacterium]
MKKVLSAIMVFAILLSIVPVKAEKEDIMTEDAAIEYKIRYDKPADTESYDAWEKLSLPVGNGNIGGNVFGGYDVERITLNEKTMWSGGPAESRPDYNGGNNVEYGKYGETLKEVQRLFAEGKNTEASKLCDKLIGDSDGYGGYQQFGNLYLDFGKVESVENYSRGLDIESGIAFVEYDYNGVHYTREIFTSYQENVMVIHLTTDGGELDVNIALESENGGAAPRSSEVEAIDNTILLTGELDDNQLKYAGFLEVTTNSGTILPIGEKLHVKDTDEAIIILSMGTDYALDYPIYRTGETQDELNARVISYVNNATKKNYEKLKEEHIEDITELLGRVELDLGQKMPQVTTDELLAAYKADALEKEYKAYLEVLLFQYGRYLLVSSSRENNILPANLQGIWVGKNGSAWNSDYHINVNLQMNYWHAYNTNLKECAIPMIDYVEGFREPGRVTANIYFGVESTDENPENGFTANTQSTPYGWTAPGWSFDWGWSPASVPWMLQNVWEYYEYTLDEDFLRETIYPIMKEQAVFYSQVLIEDEDGRLISTPAYSPEHGPRTNGNTYEQSLIWQLFTDTITAGEILGENEEVLNEWRSILSRLRVPIEIGDDGQIKEWYEETTLGSVPKSDAYGHRHISHLLGLYPGDLISVDTPEWFEAARVSLDARVDASTGWAMGQRINTWARLGDGEHMYQLIETLMKTGILDNLWDTHPPFQIDGNFGYTAGVAEALMQSNMGYINILPAIPSAWSEGEVKGLVARGNYEVGIKWNDSIANEVTIKANEGGDCVVQLTAGDELKITDSKGNNIAYKTVQKNRISFAAEKGEAYTISNSGVVVAPKNIEAIRYGKNRVKLSWDEVKGVKGYNIYRKADEGEFELVASDVKGRIYKDASAPMDKVYTYMVSSVSEKGTESELSEEICETGGREEIVDSNDGRVRYAGSWQMYTESDHYMSTNNCSWTKGSTAELKFYGTGIELYSVAKPNYNAVNIYIDGEKVGENYSVNSKEKRTDFLVFSKKDLKYGEHTIKVEVLDKVVTGVKDLSISVDYFKVYSDFLNTGIVAVKEKGDDYVSIETDFDDPGKYIMIVAAYEDMMLKDVATRNVEVPCGVETFKVDIKAKDKMVKVFLWNKNIECFSEMIEE